MGRFDDIKQALNGNAGILTPEERAEAEAYELTEEEKEDARLYTIRKVL